MIHPKFLLLKRDDKINSAYLGFLLAILDKLLWKRHMSILIIFLVNLFNGISAKTFSFTKLMADYIIVIKFLKWDTRLWWNQTSNINLRQKEQPVTNQGHNPEQKKPTFALWWNIKLSSRW